MIFPAHRTLRFVPRFVLLIVALSNTGVAQPIQHTNRFTAPIPAGGKSNIFDLDSAELYAASYRGKLSFLEYPVRELTLAAPYASINRLYNTMGRRPLVRVGIRRNGISGIGRSWHDIWRKAGLTDYPARSNSGAYHIPFPATGRPNTPIGFSVFEDQRGTSVFTLSCASCHTRNLFGRPVLGASNLVSGTGSTLLLLQRVGRLNARKFRFATRAGAGEQNAFRAMQCSLSFVQGKHAQAAGLENPVAFVGLSMAGRAPDSALTKDYRYRGNAYRTQLSRMPTDTKPPVLWNLKYKNRFQHDGSMRGDPMLANVIFNEIGRGGDMQQLENWIRNNRQEVRDLAAAGYAMEAPKWTDFFAADSINVTKAKRGEELFQNRCAECHGEYDKAWSQPNAEQLSPTAYLKTVRVTMPEEDTIVRNVGTDPSRSLAMQELAPMANRLSVFRNNGISFEANPGAYVPPPLVGVWARWPYMHNNSIPNLEQLLTTARERVSSFYVGEANNPSTDYDTASVGFPIGARTPAHFRRGDRLFDTRRPGLRNIGHDEGIFATNGLSELTQQEKWDLIEFLKTL
jgi:mono/diheme cytochrome c family protein